MAQSKQRRMMHLGAFVHETGQHVAAWRHPKAHAEAGVSFAQAVEVAQTAERGKFDLLFLAGKRMNDEPLAFHGGYRILKKTWNRI